MPENAWSSCDAFSDLDNVCAIGISETVGSLSYGDPPPLIGIQFSWTYLTSLAVVVELGIISQLQQLSGVPPGRADMPDSGTVLSGN